MAAIVAVRSVDDAIEQVCLLLVALRHLRQAALCENPVCDFADHVDVEGWRRVVERVLLEECRILEHRRQRFGALLEERFLCDDERHAGRAEVLLDAGIDEVEFAEINRAREHVARHVGKEGHALRIGNVVVLRAVDRVVVAEVDVGGIRRDLELVLLRDVLVAAVLARGCDDADAEVLGFLVRFFCKAAGEDVSTRMLLRSEVQWQQGELRARAACHEQDFIVVAEIHELLDVGFRLVLHRCVFLRAVADFEDRFAASAEVQELCLCFLEDGQRQRRRAGIEVVDAICFQRKNLPTVSKRLRFQLSVCYILARKNQKSKHEKKNMFFSRAHLTRLRG